MPASVSGSRESTKRVDDSMESHSIPCRVDATKQGGAGLAATTVVRSSRRCRPGVVTGTFTG